MQSITFKLNHRIVFNCIELVCITHLVASCPPQLNEYHSKECSLFDFTFHFFFFHLIYRNGKNPPKKYEVHTQQKSNTKRMRHEMHTHKITVVEKGDGEK